MNELERFMIKYGPYFAVAICAVAVYKLYSTERQALKTVVRSVLASLLITFLIVKYFANAPDQSLLFVAVAVSAFLCDMIVEGFMQFGAKVKSDPTILLKWFKK